MTTLVRADEKGRLCIRGTKKGEEYLVRKEENGWSIRPVTKGAQKQKRRWTGSSRSLADHLQALADSGLRVEQAEIAKEKVGPCRF
jgi:hypothetical protein